ncbi:hypothetical protein [Ornithinimicrobium kibberense]|uniref:hypothetical protein n=1 Tax=Ornithinimicrobium kibberense TaxID=282060 RepID=UPI00360DE03D
MIVVPHPPGQRPATRSGNLDAVLGGSVPAAPPRCYRVAHSGRRAPWQSSPSAFVSSSRTPPRPWLERLPARRWW